MQRLTVPPATIPIRHEFRKDCVSNHELRSSSSSKEKSLMAKSHLRASSYFDGREIVEFADV